MSNRTIEHPRPTHAGGVVYRVRDTTHEFLVVTARKRPEDWVFPKGHVEKGETAAETAVREVEEEAGVRAIVTAELDDLEIEVSGKAQHIRYFLMEMLEDGLAREPRQLSWLSGDDATARLSFDGLRAILCRAIAQLRRVG